MNLYLRRALLAAAIAGAAVAITRLLTRGDATPATPSGAPAAASAPGAVEPRDAARLAAAIDEAFAATLAAFAADLEPQEYDARDARAERGADELRDALAGVRPRLGRESIEACDALVERIDAARLQLMAFAINRKNRGVHDAAQSEAERADRAAFAEAAEPIYRRAKSTLG